MPARTTFLARPRRFLPVLACLAAWAHAHATTPSIGAESEATPAALPSPLALVERSVVQEQGGWKVDYRLRHQGPTTIAVNPTEVLAKVEAWVSNSRVASHAIPRFSTLVVSGPSGLSAFGEVIHSSDEGERCRERAVLQVWTGDAPDGPPDPIAKAVVRAVAVERQPTLSLSPGEVVRVRLRFEHHHVLYGDYDPLLGQRSVELHLGPAVFRDVVPMEFEQYLAYPKGTWPAVPDERRDPHHFVSAPDSLHIEAHVPGNQYYRFPERPVRYATKMRLRFWYLIASGTEGECHARIAQYKETPTSWKPLPEGDHDHSMATVGRWAKVERIFRTEPEATTLSLDFRISGADIGEMWIDDISLEPIAAGPAGP